MPKKLGPTGEQKAEMVLRLLHKEEPASMIARRAGISEQSLYRWRDEFLLGGRKALAGRGGEHRASGEVAQLRAQLSDRDQVIGELTVANRILKKLSENSN